MRFLLAKHHGSSGASSHIAALIRVLANALIGFVNRVNQLSNIRVKYLPILSCLKRLLISGFFGVFFCTSHDQINYQVIDLD